MSFKDKIDEILASAIRSQLSEKKKMDPVGKADADIDNDGDVDSSDEYLHNRRKAIAKAMKKEEASDEPITAKDIKMAIGIANDARYKDGNYTAAYNKIASMKKGLVSHPRVKDALRRANEELELDEATLRVPAFTGKIGDRTGFRMTRGAASMYGGYDVTLSGDEKAILSYAKRHLGGEGDTLADVQRSLRPHGEEDKQEGSCGTTNSSYMNASYLKAAAKASKKK